MQQFSMMPQTNSIPKGWTREFEDRGAAMVAVERTCKIKRGWQGSWDDGHTEYTVTDSHGRVRARLLLVAGALSPQTMRVVRQLSSAPVRMTH